MEVTCPNEGCDEKMLKKIRQVHMKESCKFKKIPCEFCGEEQWQPLKKVGSLIGNNATETIDSSCRCNLLALITKTSLVKTSPYQKLV